MIIIIVFVVQEILYQRLNASYFLLGFAFTGIAQLIQLYFESKEELNISEKEKELLKSLLQKKEEELTSLKKQSEGVSRDKSDILKSEIENVASALQTKHINSIKKIEETTKDIQALMDGIIAGGTRIARIVEELRVYARPSEGDIMQLLDIRQVIQSAITLLANTIKKKTLHFDTYFEKRIPLIKGNHQKLEQVIINVIQNACDALSSPEKSIWVRAGSEPETNEVFVEVRDEGDGIPQEIINRIFDPFFTTKREQGGIGLGLAISQRILQEHGGKFTVASTPGIGTMVKISLPAAEVYAEIEPAQSTTDKSNN